MKGQMLRTCWESVGTAITAKNEEGGNEKSMDRLSVERSFDKQTRFSRLGFIDEAMLDSRNALPLLVSPALRTRSTQKSKFSH